MALEFQIAMEAPVRQEHRHPKLIVYPHFGVGDLIDIEPLRLHFLGLSHFACEFCSSKDMHLQSFWFAIVVHPDVTLELRIGRSDEALLLAFSNSSFVYCFPTSADLSSESIILSATEPSFFHGK